MNVLDRAPRERVSFDPTNRQHREWAHQALQTNSWGQCPVKFKTIGMTDMETAVKRDLLKFYLMKEFS